MIKNVKIRFNLGSNILRNAYGNGAVKISANPNSMPL